ncbi:collagen alpha-2(I) chain-like [Passer domesticus]|uniref:collagen alpha-2(I) chain-like n=1 Tax=Passer domesticus TaxID=48849 RepID=UPI0030FEA78E
MSGEGCVQRQQQPLRKSRSRRRQRLLPPSGGELGVQHLAGPALICAQPSPSAPPRPAPACRALSRGKSGAEREPGLPGRSAAHSPRSGSRGRRQRPAAPLQYPEEGGGGLPGRAQRVRAAFSSGRPCAAPVGERRARAAARAGAHRPLQPEAALRPPGRARGSRRASRSRRAAEGRRGVGLWGARLRFSGAGTGTLSGRGRGALAEAIATLQIFQNACGDSLGPANMLEVH